MSIYPVICGEIPANELELSRTEMSARLGIPADRLDGSIEPHLSRLISVASCKYAAVRVPIKRGADGLLDLGFGEFKSNSLTHALEGCREAFVFAVTIGMETERLLYRLSLTSQSASFITDALASALAESVCDETEKIISGSLSCKRRFSPGYGDMPLAVQPALIKMLDAGRLLGITVNASLLMTPCKSITAIRGILYEE